MPILKDVAQVLRVHEQGNTSQVVVLLGRHLGQFRIHAKGSRRWCKKGFEGGFDLLTRGEILVYPRRGDHLWIVKEWEEHARPCADASLGTLRAASFLCELSDALTRMQVGSGIDLDSASNSATALKEQSVSEHLYDALAAAADALSAAAAHQKQTLWMGPVLLRFTLRALQSEGLLPELTSCAECGRSVKTLPAKEWSLWLDAEGLNCRSCRQKNQAVLSAQPRRGCQLSPDAWQALLFIQRTGKPVKLSAGAATQLAQTLIVLVHGALEHDLRTLPAVAAILKFHSVEIDSKSIIRPKAN